MAGGAMSLIREKSYVPDSNFCINLRYRGLDEQARGVPESRDRRAKWWGQQRAEPARRLAREARGRHRPQLSDMPMSAEPSKITADAREQLMGGRSTR